MNTPQVKQWASAYANQDFISINTNSGYRGSARDPKGKQIFLPLQVSDEHLGLAILEALSVSKFLSTDEVHSFFDLSVTEKNYEDWVALLMEKYNYKSRRAVFKEMKHCLINRVNGIVTIKPTNHEKLEAWGGTGIPDSDIESVRETASEVELGAALKVCLGRCLLK